MRHTYLGLHLMGVFFGQLPFTGCRNQDVTFCQQKVSVVGLGFGVSTDGSMFLNKATRGVIYSKATTPWPDLLNQTHYPPVCSPLVPLDRFHFHCIYWHLFPSLLYTQHRLCGGISWCVDPHYQIPKHNDIHCNFVLHKLQN